MIWLEVAGGVGVVLAVWWLVTTAGRIDRLHRRVEHARAALDVQLLRRATAARDLATSGLLDPASSLLIAGAGAGAIAAGEGRADQLATDPGAGRLADHDADLEAAESDLSRALRATLAELPTDGRVATSEELAVLAAACHRVRLARRFHNEATTSAVRLRSKRAVRWARLAGTAPLPRTVEIDDEPPAVVASAAAPGRG